MANSEDPDEMLHNVAFHQGLRCLLRQHHSSEKKIQYFFEIITCDPSLYIIDHPDLTVSNFMGNSIGIKRVNWTYQGCHSISISKFPDFSLTFDGFPDPF